MLLPFGRFLTTIVCTGLLAGLYGVEGTIEEGAAFAIAGEASKAAAIFDSLADPDTTEWQKLRLRYDAGTAYLYAKKWQDALARLQPVGSSASLSPLLKQRLTQNIALSRLMDAAEEWQRIQSDPAGSEEAYYALLIKLKQVDSDVANGRAAWCELAKAEGSSQCPNGGVFDAMQSNARRLYADVFSGYTKYRLGHALPETAIPELLASVDQLYKSIREIASNDYGNARNSLHFENLSQQAGSWIPFLDRLDSLSDKATNGRIGGMNIQPIIKRVRQSYRQAVSALAGKDAPGAMNSFETVQTDLRSLLGVLFRKDNISDTVKSLLISYRLALIKSPLQISSLMAVQEGQNALRDSLKDADGLKLLPFLDKANRYLSLSIESIEASAQVRSRIFAEAALSFIGGIEQRLLPSEMKSGETVLEDAIRRQEFAQRMNQLRFQLSAGDPFLKEIDTMVSDLQTGVLDSASLFTAGAIAGQRRIFDDPGFKGDRCQCRPWNNVVPLYDEGYVKAMQAKIALGSLEGSIYADRFQLQAIEAWKEALALLKEPEREQAAEEQSLASPSKNIPPAGTALNDVLRNVQEMENDDRSRPIAGGTGPGGGGDMPW